MDNANLIRLSENITALNGTLQRIGVGQERLADSVDALRRAQDEAREEQGFGWWWLLGTIFGGVLVGTLIGNTIGGPTTTDRTTASGETRRREPP